MMLLVSYACTDHREHTATCFYTRRVCAYTQTRRGLGRRVHRKSPPHIYIHIYLSIYMIMYAGMRARNKRKSGELFEAACVERRRA